MSRIKDQARIAGTEQALRQIAEQYYLGCRAYHQLVKAGSDKRVLWHIRLKTLAQTGNQLADALMLPRPNWPALYHISQRYSRNTANPFQAVTR
jgi:hypothetical protein